MRHHLRRIGGAALLAPQAGTHIGLRTGLAGETAGSIRWGCAVTHTADGRATHAQAPSTDIERMLSGVQRMLFDDRVTEALAVSAQLANADDPRTRVDARIYRLA